jgi:filamentous hemagglutinin family protein
VPADSKSNDSGSDTGKQGNGMANARHDRVRYNRLFLLGSGLLLGAWGLCRADISPDGTMGSVVGLSGLDYSITGGTRFGSNLFHSFSIFDVQTGETATFSGPAAITNIIGRVTGGTASSIDGTLGSGITGANLYLVNPAGVIFGPNASLNVDGSFHVSTADYLVLGQTGRFDASNPGNSVLATAPPSAFGYLSANPAPVTLHGSDLRVPVGATLSVVAGDIQLTDASLYASEGQVNIASVGSAGEVVMTANGPDTGGFARLGEIRVTQTTFVTQRPTDNFFPLANIDASGNGGGEIYIRGEQLVMDNGYVFADSRGSGTGGLVDVSVRGDVELADEARITADAGASTGSGGDITINAQNVALRRGGQLSAATYGAGAGGTIDIHAVDSITLDGKSGNDPRLFGGNGAPRESAIVAESFSSGQGGTLSLHAARLALDNESLVSVSTARDGDAGSIAITAGRVDVAGGSGITSDSSGAGRGGAIDITASGTVQVTGALATGNPADPYRESSIRSNTFGAGDGGSITLRAGEVRVTDRGVIQANIENNPTLLQPAPGAGTRAGRLVVDAGRLVLLDGGQLVSANVAGGIGGDINVTARDVTISGQTADGSQTSGIFSVTASAGPSGAVVLKADTLAMSDLGSINTSTIDSGAAGSIQLRLQTAALQGGARISSSTGATGNGGLIDISASGAVSATGLGGDGFGSGFYSDVQAASGVDPATVTGTGGNIDLAASRLLLNDQATVSAKSSGAGDAGSIHIHAANAVELQHGATITTQAVLSGGGRITVNTGNLLFLNRSGITSSVQDGSGNGGDITIDPLFVVLLDSQVLAQAFAGNGGNITISAGNLFITPGTVIDASSQLGIAGDIVIDSPEANITGSLVQLPEDYVTVTNLLRNRCTARIASGTSSLVVQGQGGVAPAPDEVLATWDVPAADTISTDASRPETVRPVILQGTFDDTPALLIGCAG